MVLLVPDDIVFASCESRHDSEVDSEAGAVYHHVLFADVFGDTCFEGLVEIQGAVEKGGASATGSVFFCSLYGGFFDAGVVYEPGIAV